MQLGELQNQIARFERRGVRITAISVDAPADSLAMIERLGLSFDLASDPEQQAVKAFGVQNPDTRELALHAVYIVDGSGTIFYRKVGRRRPTSNELIDAIDAHRGDYPQNDPTEPRRQIAVAYPQNDYQTLLEVARAEALPQSVDAQDMKAVIDIIRQGELDNALVRFKRLIADSPDATREALLETAAWLTRNLFFVDNEDAIETGKLLQFRLQRIATLEAALETAADSAQKDKTLHELARARAGLSLTRAKIEQNARAWQLAYAKTTLRSYREVAQAARL